MKCVWMPRNEAVCFACIVVAYERQSVDQTSTMKCVLSSSVVIYLISLNSSCKYFFADMHSDQQWLLSDSSCVGYQE